MEEKNILSSDSGASYIEIQRDIIKLLDGLWVSQATEILRSCLQEVERHAIVKLDLPGVAP